MSVPESRHINSVGGINPAVFAALGNLAGLTTTTENQDHAGDTHRANSGLALMLRVQASGQAMLGYAKLASPRSSPSFPRKPFEVCPLQTQDGESRRLCWTFCRVAAVLGFSRSRQAVLFFGERMIHCRFHRINLSICTLWRTWWCRMAFYSTDGTSSSCWWTYAAMQLLL